MIFDYQTLTMLIQKIGRTSQKSSIFVVSVVFVEDIYFLSEDVSTLTETTILENNQMLIKTSLF